MNREYDSTLDITAGEMRAMGATLPEKFPDCAWVPRSAVKFGELTSKVRNREERTFDLHVSVEISEPFRWLSLNVTIDLETGDTVG